MRKMKEKKMSAREEKTGRGRGSHMDSLQGYKPKDYVNLPPFVPREMFSYYAFYLWRKGCEPLQWVTVGTFCVVSG